MASSAWPAAGVPGWAAIGASLGLAVCYPVNGSEVERAVNGSTCTLIVLLRDGSQPYTIKNTLNVTRTVIIIGNPVSPPALNGTTTERLFHGRHPPRCFDNPSEAKPAAGVLPLYLRLFRLSCAQSSVMAGWTSAL
jgi:hypothetical protein